MKRIIKVARGIGKVILALLTAVLMPILIWIALGVALNNKLGERKTRQVPAPTIGEILAKAGLTIQEDTTTGKPVAAQTFTQQPISGVRELVTKAGLTIQEEPVLKHYMERTKELTKGVGKVILALVGGALMPILIWVAFGAAMNQKLREKSAQRKPAPAVDETLAADHVLIQDKKS